MAVSPKFRLTVGKLVSVSLGIYLRNIIPFLFLGGLVMGPWIALEFWLPEAGLSEQSRALIPLGVFILQSVLTNMLTGAITYGVVMQLRGSPAGLGDSIGKGLSSLLRVIGTGFIVAIRIFLWSLLLYVPGIIESVRLFVALPVAVMEGKAGNSAAQRSKDLVSGSGWPVFGAYFLTMVLAFLISMIAVFLIVGFEPDFDRSNPWLSTVITVPLSTFSSTMMAVAYFLLRKGKENVDAKEIAKIFD